MVDRHKHLHRSIVDQPSAMLEDFLATRVPYNSDVEQMGIHRAPVNAFAPSGIAAGCYASLWSDIKEKLVSYPP